MMIHLQAARYVLPFDAVHSEIGSLFVSFSCPGLSQHSDTKTGPCVRAEMFYVFPVFLYWMGKDFFFR